MLRFLFTATSLCLFTGLSFAGAWSPGSTKTAQAMAAMPAWFESAGKGAFLSRNANGTLFVNRNEARYQTESGSVRMTLLKANPLLALAAQKPLTSRGAYWIGNRKQNWRANVSQFAVVRGAEAYPGIDVLYHFNGKALEFDFAVAPGADPGRIQLAFDAPGNVRVNSEGDLIFPNGIAQRRPVAYQEVNGRRKEVAANYVLNGQQEVRFQLGAYDRSQPLIIDPILYSSYLGGDRNEIATAMTVDRLGNVWVTGSSASYYGLSIPNAAIQNSTNGAKDVFLAGFTPDATGALVLFYWTQLGGGADDEATTILVDDSGLVYLGGYTTSSDFPRGGAALQADPGGARDAFITVLRPDLGAEALQWSQFYGGNNDDVITAMTVDGSGNVYFAGNTRSDSLTGVDAMVVQGGNRGGADTFFGKAIPAATSNSLAYASYFGGSGADFATGIALTAQGKIWIAGYTNSPDFPSTGDATQAISASGTDLFVARFDISKSGLDGEEYCSYLGWNGQDVATGMKMDSSGQLWITGYTFSTDFQATNGLRSQLSGTSDAFVLRYDPAKAGQPNPVTYATLIGGSATDVIYGITFLPNGRVALAGYTFSPDFAVIGEERPRSLVGGAKAFVVRLDAARGADSVTYSNLLAGTLNDVGTAVAADASGLLYLTGYTFSRDFPVTNGSVKQSGGGQSQSFVVTMRPVN